MAEFDYADLLERTRQGMPRDELAPVMPALLDVDNDFENPTKLRLLGNAIANNKPNARALQERPEAIDRLLSLAPLGLQILYNGSVDNKEFSLALAQTPRFAERLPATPVAKTLVGALLDALGGDAPAELEAHLAVAGFVELVLNRPELEQHPVVVENFARIYAHCQQITQAASADVEDDFTSLGFQVVGNISSHRAFGLAQAADLPTELFTWDTVALLANLTAARANLEAVFAQWPALVLQTIELLEQEDPEDPEVKEIVIGGDSSDVDGSEDEDEDEDEDKDKIRDEDEDEQIEDEEEEDEDEDEQVDQPPFDLNLWGALFRNVARHPPAARQLAQHEPAKLVSRLLDSPLLQEVAWDFASTFSANCYDHELVALITQEPYSGGSVLVASAAAQGVLGEPDLPRAELEWAVPRLVRAITAGLAESAQVPVWVKGTRALALLRAAQPALAVVDVERLAGVAPADDAVASNLDALRAGRLNSGAS